MTRNGKIARLPRRIRQQINVRLANGELGGPVLEWLNGQAEVKEVLEAQFAGAAISKQNLSEWKSGEHREWLRNQEACELAGQSAGLGEYLDETAEGVGVSDRLARVLTVELVRTAKALLAETKDPNERWQRLQELLDVLEEVRKRDHRGQLVQLAIERWEQELARLSEEKRESEGQKARDRAVAPILAAKEAGILAEAFGGGETGLKVARYIAAVNHGLPIPETYWSEEVKAGQTQSKPVKPSQT